jgi:VIT1/CCC1 family predicted Fe2+/Mn2+ transporter
MTDHEKHRSHRAGWLRAAVMGANDGIVSTASLIIGVAAAGASTSAILLSGLAGTVAGAMSMAAGEYVSVSSQADIEQADLEQERQSLLENESFERAELSSLYQARGVSAELADRVAAELMANDALSAHARDELGISAFSQARPVQAALSSAATFAAGAALPLLTVLVATPEVLILMEAGMCLLFLAALGAIAAQAGGAPRLRGAMRVTFWGAAAMMATALVGRLFGVMT